MVDNNLMRTWYDSGNKVATVYYDKLNDKANGVDYGKYFDTIYLFETNYRYPEATTEQNAFVQTNLINYCSERLKKRLRSFPASDAKISLGEFIASTERLFDYKNYPNYPETVDTLRKNKFVPDTASVAEKRGMLENAFVASRYDAELGSRFGHKYADLSTWKQLNWKVSAFGEWFSNLSDLSFVDLGIYLGATYAVVGIIGLVIWVIHSFIAEGVLEGIFTGILAGILGAIGYYVFYIVIFVGGALLKLLLLAIRYMFYNIYTLLGSLAAIAAYLIVS